MIYRHMRSSASISGASFRPPLSFFSCKPIRSIVISACLAVGGVLHPSLHAQTIEDGIMLANKTLCAGALYGHDSWDQYWEGSLERVNGNIGTVTTQSLTMAANYGVTNWFDAIINVPYVWTNASQGVLHGIVDCGYTGPLKIPSASWGNPISYFPSGESWSSRAPQ